MWKEGPPVEHRRRSGQLDTKSRPVLLVLCLKSSPGRGHEGAPPPPALNASDRHKVGVVLCWCCRQ